MKKITAVSLIVLSVLGLSCGGTNNKEKSGESQGTLNVDAYLVNPQSFNNDVVVTAELLANEQVSLMAPLSAQVLEIYFKEGGNVRKGDPIIRLDDRNWRAQLVGVEASLEVAEKNYERTKQLLEIEGSSQEEVDQAYSAVETLRSELEQLRVNINLANVRAPFSGQLGMRDFSNGAFLSQGDIITTLTNLNPLKIDFTLAQEHIKNVEVGKQIAVLVAGDTLKADIYAINPLIDQQSRTLNVRALLQQAPERRIMPGTFAEVLVTTNFMENALLVPTQAVVPEINNQTVYLYKKGKAVKEVVKMGNRTSNMVHILEGVSAGDTVVTTGLLHIKEGMELSIQNLK
jgi:membrane fusion protein (multidrug efflux system)